MKLLLDEHLPHRLRLEIPGHEVLTVAFMGWSGLENGELLRHAASAGFDALLSNDRGMEYEQNRTILAISVVVMNAPANTIEALRPLIPELLIALNSLGKCQFVKLSG